MSDITLSPLPEGSHIPDVTFATRQDGAWVSKSSADYFAGKRVVLFALPGAFTPTCSSTHLPGYMIKSEEVKAQGIDAIYCLSVNDAFVMNAWAKDQGITDELAVIPDGNGDFSQKMGLLVDRRPLGFGQRSWRYSMVINDGVIEKSFIEPIEAGDPFHVSDVDSMLAYLKAQKAQQAA